jgi:hypothetical protein
MRKLQIESLQELNQIFREKSVEMTNSIREGVEEAVKGNKKTAILFEIEMEGMDTSFEISITTKEWVIALENCLKHYQEWEMSDEAIDTYLLLKNIKEKYYE